MNVQRVCKVIDVFGGREDVNQRTQPGKCRIRTKEGIGFLKSIVDVVLDCLDIVAGFGFDLGEFGDGISVEFPRKRAQIVKLSVREQGGMGNNPAAKELNHPLDLNIDAGAVERGLGQVLGEFLSVHAIAAIEGRQSLACCRQVCISGLG